MEWNTFLNHLNSEYKELGAENPQIEVFGYLDGKKYRIVEIYNEDGILCIDIEVDNG